MFALNECFFFQAVLRTAWNGSFAEMAVAGSKIGENGNFVKEFRKEMTNLNLTSNSKECDSIWRLYRQQRDGIFSLIWEDRYENTKKKLFKQKPQSDSKAFPRKWDSISVCSCMHSMYKNMAFIQKHTQFDCLTKRMSNKKCIFFHIDPQWSDERTKVDKAICHWRLSNVFLRFLSPMHETR